MIDNNNTVHTPNFNNARDSQKFTGYFGHFVTKYPLLIIKPNNIKIRLGYPYNPYGIVTIPGRGIPPNPVPSRLDIT